MPYYTREMVRWMREQDRLARTGQKSGNQTAGNKDDKDFDHTAASQAKQQTAPSVPSKKPVTRVLRVTPSHVDEDAEIAISNFQPPKSEKELTFDQRRLMYMRNLLRLQVERINRIESSVPASGKQFGKYEFDLRQPIRTGSRFKMFNAKHRDFADLPMVVRVLEAGSKAVPNPLYMKILRHLGKKHPFIVQTWEVFLDDKHNHMIVQEYANRLDVATFLNKSGKQSEQVVREWAHQMYKALDYLGDMAICHMSIRPCYVLLNHKELSVRLTGFYESIVYWDPKKEDIACIPCAPVASKNRGETPDFVAPEVHGNPAKEHFDPILADLWSYAAVVYYMATCGGYPYNWRVDNVKVEEEVCDNVKKLNISDEGKSFLTALLNTNALARLTFEKIGSHVWFSKLKRENVVGSMQKL